MTLATQIYQLLSGAVECPVYRAGGMPRADIPRVTYSVIGGTSQARVGGGAANHRRARVSVVAIGKTAAESDTLLEAIIAKALGYVARGPIRAIDLEYGPYDLPEPLEGAENPLPAMGADLGVTYTP